jgi:curved DNA-binding protein CbpA
MTSSQDYYQILGVTPSAELAVIKAVYKALALKYHPDRNKGNLAAAAKKMAEINEAYSVLSDEQKRAAYDRSRRGSSEQDQFDDEEEGFDSEFSSMDSQIEADWRLAKKYYPDLDSILKKFSKISNSLVLPYKLYLLETKSFSNRNEIADGMIDAYLKTYFGSDEKIVEFAKYLLKNDQRAAARELNKAVKLFGKSINAAKVIEVIKAEYLFEFTAHYQRSESFIKEEVQVVKDDNDYKVGYGINTKLIIASLVAGFINHLVTVGFDFSAASIGGIIGASIGYFVCTYLIAAIPLMVFYNKNYSDAILSWSFLVLGVFVLIGLTIY